MRAAAKLRSGDAGSYGRIPVLDIGPYLAGLFGAAAPLARAVACTCEDTGFLVVANHGIPPRLVEDTFAAAAQFFAKPEADKLALRIGQYNIGYLPFGGQVVRQSPVNRNTKPNFSESFYITRNRTPDHPDIVNGKRLIGLTGGRRTCRNSVAPQPPTMPRWRARTCQNVALAIGRRADVRSLPEARAGARLDRRPRPLCLRGVVGVGTTREEGLRRANLAADYVRTSVVVAEPFTNPPGYNSLATNVAALKSGGKRAGFVRDRHGNPVDQRTATIERLIGERHLISPKRPTTCTTRSRCRATVSGASETF
jgi:non-haem dioxygenase in morphine synthesis N-terminal